MIYNFSNKNKKGLMSNKISKLSSVFSSNKMKVFDWVLSFISLGIAAYYYFALNNQEVAIWWFAGGCLGVVFSVWRPIDKLQNFFQRTVINKE